MEDLNETGVETTYQLHSSSLALGAISGIELCLLSMDLSKYVRKKRRLDNRFPRNESRIRSSIKCKQISSINVVKSQGNP